MLVQMKNPGKVFHTAHLPLALRRKNPVNIMHSTQSPRMQAWGGFINHSRPLGRQSLQMEVSKRFTPMAIPADNGVIVLPTRVPLATPVAPPLIIKDR